jgi:hypothetical protein
LFDYEKGEEGKSPARGRGKWEGNSSRDRYTLDTTQKLIKISQDFCYNEFTFPPIFRDGARGGNCASAI